ncbi:MAG: hypothetical protein AABY22_25805, partial [Nanoarchaeota archaeon]
MRNKTGKANTMLWVVSILGILILTGVIGIGIFGTTGQVVAPITTTTPTVGAVCSSACPTSLAWSGTVNVQNALNSTGAETFDTSMYFYDASGALTTSITDTSSGSVTLSCGNTYTAKVISVSGNSGDSSNLKSATVSGGG